MLWPERTVQEKVDKKKDVKYKHVYDYLKTNLETLNHSVYHFFLYKLTVPLRIIRLTTWRFCNINSRCKTYEFKEEVRILLI